MNSIVACTLAIRGSFLSCVLSFLDVPRFLHASREEAHQPRGAKVGLADGRGQSRIDREAAASYALRVPTVSTIFGIIIRMDFRDHAPPHFHALYKGNEILIEIETPEIIGGALPRRALGLVLDWAELHRSELKDKLAEGTTASGFEQHRTLGVDEHESHDENICTLRESPCSSI